MPDELLMDVAGVAEVAGVLGDGAAALDAAGANPAVAPDAGESTVVVAELLGSMCGAVGVCVEALEDVVREFRPHTLTTAASGGSATAGATAGRVSWPRRRPRRAATP